MSKLVKVLLCISAILILIFGVVSGFITRNYLVLFGSIVYTVIVVFCLSSNNKS